MHSHSSLQGQQHQLVAPGPPAPNHQAPGSNSNFESTFGSIKQPMSGSQNQSQSHHHSMTSQQQQHQLQQQNQANSNPQQQQHFASSNSLQGGGAPMSALANGLGALSLSQSMTSSPPLLQQQHQHNQHSSQHSHHHHHQHHQSANAPQPRFDSSEFPALGDAIQDQQSDIAALAAQQQQLNSSEGTAASRLAQTSHEFVQSAEEFPALATPSNKQRQNAMQASREASAQPSMQRTQNTSNPINPTQESHSQQQRNAQQTASQLNGSSGAGSASGLASAFDRFGPPLAPLACERYGLTGLLSVIRMTDPDLNMLALGTDLTTLGLNLTSQEQMYATFAYPCTSVPCRLEPDHVLPSCYYMQPPALKTSHLAKFTLQTLFYIFYNMPKDTLQVYAGKELYNRDWRYHKDLSMWFARAESQAITVLPGQLHNLPRDAYIYFDIDTWEMRQFKETHILQPNKFMSEQELATL